MCDYSKLTILYGTQLGLSERVALRIARLALKRGAKEVSCLPADSIPLCNWIECDHPIIIVCSNSNQGEAPDSIRETWRHMLLPDAPTLRGVHYAIFGVGDSIYGRFNLMAKLMHNRMEQLEATPLVLRGLGDESDAAGIEEQLLPWLMQLWTVLKYIVPSETRTIAATHDTSDLRSPPSQLKMSIPQSEWENILSAPLFPLYTISFVRCDNNTDADSNSNNNNDNCNNNNTTNKLETENHSTQIKEKTKMMMMMKSKQSQESEDVKESINNSNVCTSMAKEAEVQTGLNTEHYGNAETDYVNVHTFPPRAEQTFVCKVVENRRLTSEDHFQTVHHIDLERCNSSISTTHVDDNNNSNSSNNDANDATHRYEVGDALGVYCPNRTTLVDQFLQLCRYTGNELVHVKSCTEHGLIQQTSRPFLNKVMTLRFLITHYFDLDAVVSQDFMWMLSHYVMPEQNAERGNALDEDADDETLQEIRERLREFAEPTKYQEYLNYAHREKRNVCEVLYDFHQFVATAPLEMILSFTKIMLPRYFSISSSFLYDGPDKLSLTVGLLDWHTPLKRHRTGLCSEYLIHLPKDSLICSFIWQGTLTPPPMPCSLICIAAGTGVAPIRALFRTIVYEVEHTTNSEWSKKPIFLFIGCRYKNKDFLYQEEWESLMHNAKLLPLFHVIPAFSRDTSTKVYVQHKIGESAKDLVNIIKNDKQLMVYVCGNAKLLVMPIRDVLFDIMVNGVYNGDEQEAMKEMYTITQAGRYQMDTWAVENDYYSINRKNVINVF